MGGDSHGQAYAAPGLGGHGISHDEHWPRIHPHRRVQKRSLLEPPVRGLRVNILQPRPLLKVHITYQKE
jgi:hypothetical protein